MKREKITALWWFKLRHWEYWSTSAVYLPIFGYYLYLCARARSFFFFSASNPSISNGGYHMESKWDIYQLLPPGSFPETARVVAGAETEVMLARAATIGFPLVVKPDIGGRGRGVAIVENATELLQYHRQVPVDYLIQQLVDYPLEIGVFYVKDPRTGKGRITGIVEKQMLTITGDGLTTVQDLVVRDSRAAVYLGALKASLPASVWARVPAPGEAIVLVPVGNHARGATFYDVSHRVSPRLQQVIDGIVNQIHEFHFGRLDIRFLSWEALEAGEEFSIIELNGAGSEPTHMYDPSHTIFQAWKEIISHWRWLYRVSSHNRRRGYRYLSLAEGLALLRQSKAYDKRLDAFAFKPEVTGGA